MIAQLTGSISHKNSDSLIVEVSGVGYRVFVLPQSLNLKLGDEVTFYTHLYVREDQMSLYGFTDYEELLLFELLISVSGIGPKAGLGILSVGNVETIKKAIAEGRSDILKSVSGVGSKIADRAILELRGKIAVGSDVSLPRQMSQEDESAVSALVNLGYKKKEVEQALEEATRDSEDLSVEEKIKKTLKHLGK